MVPYGCRDHASRPNDAAHLGDCPAGFGNEVEHEQRQGAVERAVLERQGAGIRLPNPYPRVGVTPNRFLDKDRRIVDRGNLSDVGGPGEREGQAAGTAADVENLLAVFNPNESD